MPETPTEYFNFRDAWTAAVLRHPDLSPAEKIVMLALIMHRNRTSGLAWPSSRSLADACDVSLQTARRAMQKGEKLGLLFTVRHGTGGEGADNRASVRRFLLPRGDASETLPSSEQGTPNVGVRSEQGTVTLPSTGYPPYPQESAPLPTGEYLTHEGTHEGTHEEKPFPDERRGSGAGGENPPTDFDYFTDHIEPMKRSSFKRFVEDQLGENYEWMLDEFAEANEFSTSRNWIKKFLGFARDWSESHAA